ncbi:MAG: TIM barrel protein [Phycisphaeraceae bacterium]|nr:TIM barrel protein [Phycisphaeraceae bacterium]
MLLTLSAVSLRSMLAKGRGGRAKLELLDLPRFTREDLGLHGLNLSTELLTGVSREVLEKLRERADKAGCACLLLIESEPQPFGDAGEAPAAGAVERMQRVIQAASLLGCNAVAVRVSGEDTPECFARTADRLRKAVHRAEKMELNLLISPHTGLTQTPERITELIKKIGGFRVGTFPDFQAAAASGDPTNYLRRLTPYASVVSATTIKFVGGKEEEEAEGPLKHQPYDLEPLVNAILSVGYDGTLGIDYRGTGDAKVGVLRSRAALESLLDVEDLPEEEEPE